MGIFDKKTPEVPETKSPVEGSTAIKKKQVELSDEDLKQKGKMNYSPLSHEIICRKHGVAIDGWEEIESNVRITMPTYDGTMRKAAVYRKEKNGRTFLCTPKNWANEPPLQSNKPKLITVSKMKGD